MIAPEDRDNLGYAILGVTIIVGFLAIVCSKLRDS